MAYRIFYECCVLMSDVLLSDSVDEYHQEAVM